jgi:hypothetical protein
MLLLGHEIPWTLPTPCGRASRRQVAPALVVETTTAPVPDFGGTCKMWGPPTEAQSELVGQEKPKTAAAGRPVPAALAQCRPPSFVTATEGAGAPGGFPIPTTMQCEASLHESKGGNRGPG